MAKAKGTSRGIVIPTKVPPVWQIGILFPDGKKISKPRCTLNEIFETYFMGLDKYISYANKEGADKLLDLYKKTFESKGIKVQINYIDSWGHKWKGKVAWPKEDKFIEYLNKRMTSD